MAETTQVRILVTAEAVKSLSWHASQHFFLLYQSACHVDTYTAFTKKPVLVGGVEQAAPWCNG